MARKSDDNERAIEEHNRKAGAAKHKKQMSHRWHRRTMRRGLGSLTNGKIIS